MDELPFGVGQISGVSHPPLAGGSGQKSTATSPYLVSFFECSNTLVLAEIGVGLEAVGDVYNAVWDYQQMIRPFVEIAAKHRAMQLVRDRFSKVEVSRLQARHGITNEAFSQAVFSLRPTMPFGLKRLTMQDGELLYE